MGFPGIPTVEVGATGGIADPNREAITPAQLLTMIMADSDPKLMAINFAIDILSRLPGWFKSCSETHSKATMMYDQLRQLEGQMLNEHGLKPVVNVEPYDNNPTRASLSLQAIGPEMQANEQPAVAIEAFVIGQNQKVTITYDLFSEYWGPWHGCQGEWSWVKIIGNKNGQPWTVFERCAKASGTWYGIGQLGEVKGQEVVTFPTGQYIIITASSGSATDKINKIIGKGTPYSYARATVDYDVPKEIKSFLGIGGGIAAVLPWLLIGSGGLYLAYSLGKNK